MITTKRNRGFTLIEVVIAASVLAIFFAAIATIVQMVLSMVGESRVRSVASNLAQTKIERVRNLIYSDVGTVGGIPNGVIDQTEIINVNGQDFQIETVIVYVDDEYDNLAPNDLINTDYKRVKISVSWGGAFASREPISVITDISPKGSEEDEGGGVLSIKVISALGEPVSGANVSVVNTVAVPNINLNTVTNVNGEVILPGAPICSTCYEIVVTKNGYSTDKTSSTTDAANPSKPHVTVIEGEVTQATFAIDLVSTLTVRTTGSRSANYPSFSGVSFVLRGSKTLGTTTLDDYVYKYQQTLISGIGGVVNVNNLEWDTYSVDIPSTASVDFAGSAPLNPFSILPGTVNNLWIVTAAATANTILVVVKDTNGTPLENANVTLLTPTGALVSGVTGSATKGDFGQVLFPGLTTGEYGVIASASGYLQASSSAIINGDITEVTILEQQ